MPISTDDPAPVGEELRLAIQVLCEELGIADLYVFGSRASEIAARARGEGFPTEYASPDSDIDVGVRPIRGRRIDIDDFVRLAEQLEGLLGARRVDVVLITTAKPFLALEVIRGELLHCADPHQQAEHELYVLRRAGDLAPFQRLREKLALSRYVER